MNKEKYSNEKVLNDEFYPPIETVNDMEVGDTCGFNWNSKHWTITRDE